MKSLRKTLAFLFVIMLIAAIVPVTVFAAGEGQESAGSFAMAAIDKEGLVIEPCLVEYDEDDTIKDALKKSGHEFYDIDADWIDTIDGRTDNYMRYYDNGAYDLERPASDIKTAIVFTSTEMTDPNNHLELIKLLAEHELKDEAIRKYGEVKKAYETAFEALPTANSARAKTLADNLSAAYDKYEAWINQDKCKVTIQPMQNGENVSAKVTLEDTMGNKYEQEGKKCEFEILEETYSFNIRKEYHEVSGTFKVEKTDKTKSLSPELPHGNWVGPIKIKDNDKVEAETVTVGNTTTATILDTTYSPYINIMPGDDIPVTDDGTKNTKDYRVYSEHTAFSMGTYYGDEDNANHKVQWSSNAKRLVESCEPGLEEKHITLKVIHKNSETGYMERQYHDLVFKKIPTIKGLKLVAGKNALVIDPSYDVRTNEYTAETIADTVSVTGYSYSDGSDERERCGKYSEGYSIEINGTPQEENGKVDVPVTEDPIEVKVVGTNGLSSSCKVKVNKVDAKTIVVNKPSPDVYITLKTSTDSILTPDEETDENATFVVAPGTYTWITTLDKYYHASGSVTTGEGTVTADGVMPVKEQLISDLATYSGIANNAITYEEANGKAFSWQDHEYTFLMSDFATTVYAAVKFGTGVTVTREAYHMTDGVLRASGVMKSETRALLTRIIGQGSKNNNVSFTAAKKSGNITYFQDYIVSTKRFGTLESLEVHDKAGNPLQIFANGDESFNEFDSDITDYVLKVGETSEEVSLTAGFSNPTMDKEIGEYTIKILDKEYVKSESGKTVTQSITLDPEKDEEEIKIFVSDDNEENVVKPYVITVEKIPPVSARFNTVPEEANVFVTDDISGTRIMAEEDGSFSLLKGFSYTYTASAYGYVGTTGKIKIDQDETIDITLTKAPENSELDTNIQAEWPYFRADENNNGVVDHKVPVKASDTVIYWANKIGEGYSSSAAGCPIMADGYIYSYSGGEIVKMDKMTGEVLARGEMATGSAFAINSPTYAEGMIFIGLNNGGVQAFNAKNLKSLWVYKDVLGGQPNCQITYKDGYIYTGFWNSETKSANFVCLSVTDEDPSLTKEEKLPAWTYTGKGFYWAGAYASDKFVIVGSDDGMPGYSNGCGTLLSIDPKSGKVIDKIDDQFTGDIRSSICYDEKSGRYYFVSKDGLFCTVKINEDGTFVKDSATKLQLLENGGKKGMSTSTPVVYNGRAYVGVSGTGTFAQYTGHNITVLDLEGSRPVIAYRVATQGYPQTSGLLTTAYDEGDGSVYVYFFDNFTPGKLRVIKDKPGQTEPDTETLDKEEYEQNGQSMTADVASSVFTPYGDQAQYAICSPISDEWGNIYFKNDSAYMMMIGPKITKLEVTHKPTKTSYKVGEVFDPEGMKVTATFANGKTRDVTEYVNYTKDPLTADDTEIDILFDCGKNMKMYQNADGEAGAAYTVPPTSVAVKISEAGFTPTLLTSLELESSELEYTGEELHPVIKTINGLTTLVEGTDYTVTWPEESKEPGTYTVTVKGLEKYTGTVTAEYTIKKVKEPEDITSVTIDTDEFTYDGKNHYPVIKLINGKDDLKEGVDYEVDRPSESAEVGSYEMTVRGIGDYRGSVTKAYKINEAEKLIEISSLELSWTESYYTGQKQMPEILKVNNSYSLVEDRDYTVEWPDESTDVGTYTVKVKGIGKFTGEAVATYDILEPLEPQPIYHVRLTKDTFTYNGTDQRPTISQVNEGYDLEEYTDYTVEWPKAQESVNAGTYQVTVTGMGNYVGSVTVEYTIEPAEIETVGLSQTKFTYNGKVQMPTIKDINENFILADNGDYKVSWPKSPVNAGTYTVTVTGTGNYIGKARATFTIEKAVNPMTVKPLTKTVKRGKKFKITASAKGGAKLTYKITKNKKCVKLVKKGKKYYIQGKKKGKAVVSVTAAATANYKKTVKKINVTVK